MSNENPKSNNLKKQRELLKELVRNIYGFKQIDYRPKELENPNEFTISLSGYDLVKQYSQTNTYHTHFQRIFLYSFVPSEEISVAFEKGNPSMGSIKNFSHEEYIGILVENTLKNFVGEEVLNHILKEIVRTMKYYVTTDSIFKVMTEYDSYHGIPIICTETQYSDCMSEFGNQYAVELSSGHNNSEIQSWTFDEFYKNHQDIINTFAKLIYKLLVKTMLPIFFKKDITDEEMENQYQNAKQKIKHQLTELFESEARKKLCPNKDMDVAKNIILVDKDCKIEELRKTILYYPDCAPVLSEWQIPVHQYRKYHAPNYSEEDIKDVILHPARLNSAYFPLADLQADEQTIDFPISEIKIPCSQNMFYDFQIQYWTSENKFQSDGLFLQYNVDLIISSEIKERWVEQIKEHWVAVFDLIKDILQRVFSIDFVSLIKETPLENNGQIYDKYLDIFSQRKIFMLDENTYSAFLPKELIQRHYFLQQVNSSGYSTPFGEDYISQFSMRQATYILIPLISNFVSELKKNLYDIAGVIGDIVSKKEFDSHVKQVSKYLESNKLEEAVQAWDEAYSTRKKYELQSKRRSVQDSVTITPDYRMLGLMKYTEENGNLFQNLKSVLEEYLYCLQELC